MDCSTPGIPVHHQLPELTQTHVHWVGDAIQPSHPLSSPSLLTSSFPSIRVFSNESVLRITWPKYWSFSISPSSDIQDWSPLGWTGWIPLLSKRLSRVFSSTTVQKHQLNYCLNTFNEDPYLTTQCISFCCHIALIISKLRCWKNKKLQICNTRSSTICIFLYF